MSSEVEICNSALSKIGTTNRIASLTEGSTNATACNGQYAKVRDKLLRAHHWNFAMTRAKLARLADAPVYEFDYGYQLPSDWIRMVAVHDNDAGTGQALYRIEGRKLLCNADGIWIKYVARVTDPNDMPADFRETLASLLAVELALPIAQSNTIRTLMLDQFRRDLIQAKSTDSIEDYPPSMPEGSWVTERG